MNYIADEFHIHYISSYTLLASSDYQYDHLVVLDENKTVLVYMTYETIKPSTEAMRILSLPFQNVKVTLGQQSLVLVPQEVYRAEDIHLYDEHFVIQQQSSILTKNLPSMGITALYQFDMLLYNRWKNLFFDAKFIPVFAVVLRQAQTNIPIHGETLGVHLYDNQADIFLFVNGVLQIYNSYEVKGTDDLSYFVLNIFQHFDIKQKIQKIILSGSGQETMWAERLGYYTDDLEIVKAKVKWAVDDLEISSKLLQLNVLADSELCV